MLALNTRSLVSVFNTNLSGAVGAVVWMMTDFYTNRKFTTIGICNGIFAGLVCVTPASGYIHPHFALVFGAVGALVARAALHVKLRLGFDDTLDVLPIHGFGGAVCLFLFLRESNRHRAE